MKKILILGLIMFLFIINSCNNSEINKKDIIEIINIALTKKPVAIIQPNLQNNTEEIINNLKKDIEKLKEENARYRNALEEIKKLLAGN